MRTMKRQARGAQGGFSLIELLISLTMLTIGMAGIAVLVTSAMVTNYRNRNDTTATMLSQRVLSRIASTTVNSATTPTITDCGGTAWTIATTAGGTSNASLVTVDNAPDMIGNIDWSQNYSAIGANYRMRFQTCSGTRYEVRWNITAVNAYTNQVTVGARALAAASGNASLRQLQYGTPVTLRSIVGE